MAQLQPPESRHDQQMIALARILRALRMAPTVADALTLALNHLHQILAFEVVWMGRYEAGSHRVTTHGYHCPEAMPPIRTTLPITPGDLMEQTIIQKRPVMVANLQAEPRAGEWGRIAQPFALQSAVVYPIKRQETCFGLLVMASQRWGVTLSTGELSYLAIVNGSLAEVLHQFAAEQQRQQVKRIDQPLIATLGRLRELADLDSQLQEVVRETQRFLGATRTRVFWLEPKGNYFWQRHASPATASQGRHPGLKLPVADLRSLYQALCHDSLVVVGESQGTLHAVIPQRLMQQLQAQAVMVAPITRGTEVVGFVWVEESRPRLWQETDKQLLMAMAGLLSLVVPGATSQETDRHSQIEQDLAAKAMQGIRHDRDWHQALQTCFTKLRDHLGIQQLFVLRLNAEGQAYDLCFHGQSQRPAPILALWPKLDDVDKQMLEHRTLPVVIDSLPQDLKLMAWRPHLLDLGAQAVMACSVAPGHALEGIVIVSDQTPRQWTAAEQTLMMAVGRQIGVMLHQWQIQRQMAQQQDTYEALEWGLQTLHQSLEVNRLEQTTLEYVLQWLRGSVALLVAWLPGESQAKVSQVVSGDGRAWVQMAVPIPTDDALIHWACQAEDLLTLPAHELTPATQAWLLAPTGSRLLVKALRTHPRHAITAVLVVVAPAASSWNQHQLTIVNLLINQLAWSRRYLHLGAMLTQQRQDLEHLNWYKHQHLESFHRQVTKLLADLNSHTPDLRQFQQRLGAVADVIDRERWQMVYRSQTIPLVSLLHRLVERMTPVLESRQLWSQVHNETDRGTLVAGDSTKLEMVIYEVLRTACQRAPVGSRIDLWCRTITLNWLEISITDHGDCSPALLEELKASGTADALAPSQLDDPPGLHLAICKTLLDQLGGEFSCSQMEDGRIHSRLLLPLDPPSPAAIP
ncbi:MAG: GAF domain-containing protein [Leptolyngbya sp.]|nr:GAF domain-containing protein [Leptolyngbya sp.]